MTIRDITGLDMIGVKRLLRDWVVNNISPDVLSDPAKSSIGDALLSISAYPVSELAVNHLNWQINESNLDSCVIRSSAERLARNNAYIIHNANAAEVTLQFQGTSTFSVPKGFKVSSSAGTNDPVIFSTTSAGTASYVSPGIYRLSLNAIQAEYKSETGITNGVEDFEITLQQSPVIVDNDFLTSGVVINGLTYTGITNRADAGPTDRVFTYFHDKDNKLVLRFGDNEFGVAVPHNVTYSVSYKIGGGLKGNVAPGSITTLQDSTSGLNSVTNPNASTGGSDEESINEIKANAINNIFVRRAALTANDYKAIAVEVNGIAKAQAVKNIASTQPPTIDLFLGSEGATFAVPDAAKIAEVVDYFYDKMPLGVSLQAYPATEQKCKVVVDLSLEAGTNQAEAENTVKDNIVALLNYPDTTFDTTLLAYDVINASQINGVQGPNIIECHIIPEIVAHPDNVGNPTNPLGVILRPNCEVAYNLISATGGTTFAVTKKIPRTASILSVDSVKDLTIDYTEILSDSTSITVKSGTVNSLTDATLAMDTDQYQGYLLVDSNENVFLISSNNATKFSLSNNALNQGVGDFDITAGEYRIVRSFRNRTIEKAGATRKILYNTQNQWFIDNIGEGDLTLIMAKDDRWFIEIPNGSGSVGTLYVSTDGDYAFTLNAGATPFRSTPPVDTWSFITSDYAGDVVYKRDSDILTLESDNVEVRSYYRRER